MRKLYDFPPFNKSSRLLWASIKNFKGNINNIMKKEIKKLIIIEQCTAKVIHEVFCIL